jgi:hypothetical protein
MAMKTAQEGRAVIALRSVKMVLLSAAIDAVIIAGVGAVTHSVVAWYKGPA